jgi:opacity protein-like surface antigen
MRRTLIALGTALALPLAAHAQARYDEPKYYEPEKTREGPKPSIGIMGEVGLDDYNRDAQGSVDAGVGYGARVDISPQRNIGLELGYHGAVNNMSDKLSSDGRLITNQFGGDLRVNVVPPDRDLPAGLRPYVFGGAYYHRIDTDNFTPGIKDDINAFALPVGLGLEANLGDRFLVGGRFAYNFLFNEVDKFTGRNTDFWTATVNLGARLSR